MCAQQTQISLYIHALWSQSLLSTSKKFAFTAIQNAHSEDSDQTVRKCRLIWNFAGYTFLEYGS